jgi:glutathione S-transferase
VRLHGNYEKRLVETREEIARLRENLRVLDEQVAYQGSVAEDAATRAIVAGTPLADRERREATEDLRRLSRHRDEVSEQITALTAEQDDLLERLLAQSGR